MRLAHRSGVLYNVQIMGLLQSLASFFKGLFSSDGGVPGELKRSFSALADLSPPYYRFKQNTILPAFAHDLHLFCQALKPLMDLADRTLAHPDLRVSRRFFDYLVELQLPAGDQNGKEAFSYESMKNRLDNSVMETAEVEAIAREFIRYNRAIDQLAAGPTNIEMLEIERFVEICRHDWERMLGLFDPAFSLDDTRYKPEFQPVSSEQLVPELIDMYYLLAGFSFSDPLLFRIMKVFERHAPASAAAQGPKVTKLFGTLNKVLTYRLSADHLIAIIRLSKREPSYTPDMRRERIDYVGQFKKRLGTQFERDRERLLRERHEGAVTRDLQGLFSGMPILAVEGYDEEMDSYLRRESPNGFTHVKPLSILRTFIKNVFEPQIRDPIKRILVEGYFDNKNFQNSLANVLYQCERSGGRIDAFEQSLKGNGRVSLASVKRYVEEMRHGKDILPFLGKIVEEINLKAREICEDETGLFEVVTDIMGGLINDTRRPNPELVTNIRTLTGQRSKELLNQLTEGKNKVDILIRVMKNFSFSRMPPPVTTVMEDEPVSSDSAGAATGSSPASGQPGAMVVPAPAQTPAAPATQSSTLASGSQTAGRQASGPVVDVDDISDAEPID